MDIPVVLLTTGAEAVNEDAEGRRVGWVEKSPVVAAVSVVLNLDPVEPGRILDEARLGPKVAEADRELPIAVCELESGWADDGLGPNVKEPDNVPEGITADDDPEMILETPGVKIDGVEITSDCELDEPEMPAVVEGNAIDEEVAPGAELDGMDVALGRMLELETEFVALPMLDPVSV